MKSILLKLDDELFKEIDESAKELKTSKTGLIKKALEDMLKTYKRKQLEKEIAKEIEEIKKYDLDKELIKEFETASLIDLQKFYDEEDK